MLLVHRIIGGNPSGMKGIGIGLQSPELPPKLDRNLRN